ncbi:potassium channel family protein [Christiangramia salexigens]|uniref:Potassium channel domain-containing protein n=1 Tax=Christiangramia salexigens TaxID=1913577 RepID=A0A1L3J7J1_9FLAO|nr:potassium channel family protein [Christiangramia salexigens]APG61088.1 hypothetical protein LPB144_12020 [Christiangramia salexigens]
MEELLIIGGILLYLFTVLDIIQTTLSMQGGGWITSRFAHIFWKTLLKVSGGNGRAKILSHGGYFLLIYIVLIWVFLLWLSFVLLLSSDVGSVLNSSTKAPADIWEKIYYAGFTLSTLGVGDFIGSTNFWRILTTIYSFTGLILLTMSVTYFIPALTAVIEQRKMGIRLRNLGDSPQDILLNCWNGKNFDEFVERVNDLSESLVQHSQNHRAYPVIHYFHNWKQKNALILQLAKLYEAMYLLQHEVKEELRPLERELKPLEVAFENYFEVITEVTHIKPMDEAPRLAYTTELERHGLLAESSKKLKVPEYLIENRRIIHTLVIQDGWSWDLV